LDVLRRGANFVRQVEPGFILYNPASGLDQRPTVKWWTGLNVGNTSAFDRSGNLFKILGDRNVNSDEFDDFALLHEFGHFVASRFSRTDSPGGSPSRGFAYDPRLAWSEGLAHFFSAAVMGNPVRVVTLGPGGKTVSKYDMEDDHPVWESFPGYWS